MIIQSKKVWIVVAAIFTVALLAGVAFAVWQNFIKFPDLCFNFQKRSENVAKGSVPTKGI